MTPAAASSIRVARVLGGCLSYIAILLGPACHRQPGSGTSKTPSTARAKSPPPGARDPSPRPKVAVPVVGCPSEGQVGPLPAPEPATRDVALSPDIASQVSFYQAEMFPPLLAPRGWACSAAYGSDGSTMLIEPSANRGEPAEAGPLTGPAVFGSAWTGITSGREVVAELQTLIFAQPHPEDRLVQRHSRFVEYTTPAGTIGLGTEQSPLEPGPLPVHGAVRIVGPSSEPEAHFLAVRLPPDLDRVTRAIIDQMSEGW